MEQGMLELEQLEGYRLSPQQQHLWLSLPEAAAAARSQCSLLIEGRLDGLRLRDALERVIARHEILRTSFPLLSGMTVPLQVINEQPRLTWREEAAPAEALSEREQQQWVREREEQERVSEFAYESGEVVHAVLLRMGAEQAVLVLGVSGLCADAESLRQLVTELWATYEAGATSEREPAETMQYADFSEWQHELLEAEDKAAGRAYWERPELAEVAETKLGVEHEPAVAYEPAIVVRESGAGIWEQVVEVARATAASEEEVLLAAWASLVWRLSAEQQEVLVGVGYSGRKYAELAEAVGLFNKFLPVRSGFAEDATFAEVVGQVKTAHRDAHRWQEYFSSEQHGWRTDSERSGLIGFTFDEWPASQSVEDLTWSLTDLYSCTDRLKLKLALAHTAEGLRLELHYDPSVYGAAHIERLAAEYETFLCSALKYVTGTPVMRLALLGEAEQQMLLVDWNQTQATYPNEATITELFEEQVERQGSAPAVIFEEQQLTFAELNRRANQLAHHLRSLGVGKESLVGICVERSVEAIIAVLGVLKSGAAYLPLDPQYPADRISLMLEDGKVRVLVGEPHSIVGLPLHDTQVISLLADAEILAKYSEANPEQIAGAENLAYVIYTSGSTGRPKGVMIEHRSVLNLRTALAQTVYRSHQAENLRVSVNAPMAFDASVKQIIQLLNGHTLCIIPEEIRRDGEALLRYLQQQRVEVLDATPSQMQLLLAAGLKASTTTLPRLVLIGGENIDRSLWSELAADDLRTYYNVYGPTECTVDATVCRISSEYAVPTIGRAVPNATLYVLDSAGQPVPLGIAGELHIGGAGVARGYLYRPELTAERFIPHPFSTEPGARLYKTGDLVRFLEDGCLEFLGRTDHQVKLRGHRIELGEIEAALTEHPTVREVVVMIREDEPGDQRLVAYVVAKQHDLSPLMSRGRSRHGLPNGMSVVLQNRTDTDYLYEEIFEEQVYFKHGIELQPGACVFDVGANIGLFTLFVSQHCPDARIYAFEPIQPIFESLSLNAGLYGHGVKVFPFGLSDVERVDSFTYYPRYSARSGLSAYANAEDEVEVVKAFLRNKQASGVEGMGELAQIADTLLEGAFEAEHHDCRLRRLSDVIREQGVECIDLLKVDVQQAEQQVLLGIADEDWARIKQISMEVHDAPGQASEGRLGEIVKLLEQHGFAAVAEQDPALQGTDRYSVYAMRRESESLTGEPELQQVNDEALVAASPQRPKAALYRLPNALEVFHQNRNETEFIYQQIFRDRIYLRHGITLREGDCVFDVGANIGLFTLFVYEHCGVAQVYSFEPIPSTFERLRNNVALYDIDARVYNCGLSNRTGEATFTYYPRWSASSGVYANLEEEQEALRAFLHNQGETVEQYAEQLIDERYQAEQVVCKLRTISEVIRENGVERIDLLKLDAEKSELDVLEGIATEDWSRIRQVVIEVHDLQGRLARIEELLLRHGFEVVVEQDPSLRGSNIYSLYARQEESPESARRTTGEHNADRIEPADNSYAAINSSELRAYLHERLPDYMIPSALAIIAELPLTRHGKVDRRALPAPEELEQAGQAGISAARTPIEELLTGIWGEVLKVQRVGIDENFFELGGHSLLATQLMSRVREAFKLEIPLRTLFERPTVAEFAQYIETALWDRPGVQVPPIVAVSRATDLPLSFAQQRLWFLDQLEPGSAFYNSPAAVRLSGALNVEALERTLNEIVRRHEVLRTTFSVKDGEPIQRIHPFTGFPLLFTDLSHLPADEREQEVQRLATAEAQRSFNLSTGPLLRSALLGLSATEHILLLTMHHIVSDGWSIGVLIREVVALYEAYASGNESPLAELAVQYADYAVWQRQWLQGEVLEQQLGYWREQLAGAPPVLELPIDHSRPALQSYRGARFPFTLSAETSAALRALSKQEGVTLFMSLLAAFNTLLHRYSQQNQIVVGTPIANRQRGEMEGLIGFFVNTLAMRTDLSGDPSFTELLKRVREVSLDAYAHQDVPFEKLVEDLQPERDLSRSPIFQVWFVLQDDPRKELALPGLHFSTIESESATTKFDLMLLMLETEDGLTAALEYNTDLFEASTIERMAGHFNTLLRDIIVDPSQRISALRLLTSEQEQQLLAAWNSDSTSYSTDCIHDLFAEQAEMYPENIALTFGTEQMTYRELDERANQLAHYLQSLGLGPEDLVALCLERGPELIVAMLGTLKAGAAYLPLEPTAPPERLALILSDAAPALLVTQQHVLAKLPASAVRVCCLEREWAAIGELSRARPVHGAGAENLAYVIYTSGSTGQPKGVQVTHGNVSRLFASTAALFQFTELDVWSLFHSAAFDFSVWEIWGALLSGGRLVIVPYLVSRSPAEFYELLCDEGVTVLNQTPTAFAQLDEAERRDQSGKYLSLRLVIFGGEALEVGSLRGWFDRHGEDEPELVNMYGITETTVHVTYRRLRIADVERGVGSVIGQALPDLRLYVLDEQQELVPVGVAGELCVAGAGVARGYLGRAELTAERFVVERLGSVGGERMYRSGDLVRYRGDGELEYLGRKDNQVKIRGHRIELGEIEGALNEQGEIRQSVVVVREDESGAKQLVAYVVSSGGEAVSTSELRGRLRQRLPEYMLPAVVVQLSELPLTANGKVARERLPEPETIDRQLSAGSKAPQTVVEEILAGLWREVLGLEEVGMEENFFELGGHSLLATRLISRVRESLNLEVALQELFDEPTVRGLGQRVESALRRGAGVELPAIKRVSREHSEEEQYLPLSFAQQRLWFLDQFEPQSAFYNIPAAVKITGTINLTALESTLNEIIRRHEILRTTFAVIDGKPVQVINETQEIGLTVSDLSNLTESEREEEVRSQALTEARRSFDLSCGPLLRANLLKLSPTEHVLLFTLHHIITDGWSMGVLVREVGAIYEAYVASEASPLQELSIQYADFAAWQREWLQGDALARQLGYWRKQLAGAPILELPTDRARPAVQTVNGAHERLILPGELTAQLKKLSQQHGVTLFMTLLAAFQTLLARYSGQDDISVGTGIANRNRAETEELIGFFVNTLVLRTDLSGNPSFRELLTRVREVALGAYAHQDVPFEKLVEELQPERDMSRSPLFQVMFVLQNAPMEVSEWAGLQLSRVEIDGETAKFDLMFTMEERGDAINGTVQYNTDLYDRETIKRLGEHFSTLLSGIVADPDQQLWTLPLLAETEQRELLQVCNSEPSAYPREATIAELFEAEVVRRPEAPALRFNEQRLCYREVNEAANQLAHHLRAAGVGPESLVGVCLERSSQLVITLLAILKAGGAYLPLDVSYPPERISFMLQDAEVSVVVTQNSLLGTLPEHEATVICVDRDAALIAAESVENLGVRGTAEQLAYVIYTSGSTGQPKGVSVNQRAVVRLVSESNYVKLGAGDRVGQVSNASFDALTFELWGALLNGAELVVIEKEVALSAAELGRMVRAEGINVIFVTTALFNQLAHSAGEVFKGLKYLLFGGEAVDVQAVREVLREGGPQHLLHVYGPTENTTFSTFYEVQTVAAEARTVPIGRAIAQTEAYVLDQQLQVVPQGVTGELYLGGDGLARGYLNRAALTAEKFVPHPYSKEAGARLYKTGDLVRCGAEGQIEFLGRVDHQVKIRGFRIELGEIEALLSEHEAVRESLVIASGNTSNEKQLVAYVVVAAEETLSGSELRSYLKQRLPDYMVPAYFVFLEALPLTPNGKVDRRALPAAELTRPHGDTAFVAPRTPLEEQLAGLWAELLGVTEVSIDDDFFELGGHSLLATQLMSRIRASVGQEVALRELFEQPTVRGLSERIERKCRGVNDGEVSNAIERVARVSGEGQVVSFAQQRLWFLDQLEPGSTQFNLSAVLRLTGQLNINALEQTLNEVIRRHESMRTHFSTLDGQPVQIIEPVSTWKLELWSLAELSAADQEERIQNIVFAETRRTFDLSSGPLLRASLLKLNPTEHLLLFTTHHIISDGWSMGVLVREVAALYDAYVAGRPSPLPDLSIQYADFAAWQREWLQGEVLAEQFSYWKQQLSGAPSALELPTDHPRPPVQSVNGGKQTLILDRELSTQLNELSRRENVTLFMTLLAAWQILLSRYTGQKDISVGSPIAGRNRRETEELIGFFVNTLVLRTDLSGDPSFRELLSRVREVALGAYAHQDVPFEKLVEELQPERDMSRSPLFQVMFVLQNAPMPPIELTGLTISPLENDSAISHFDLTLDVVEREDELLCTLEYATDLFEETTAIRILDHFRQLIVNITSDSNRRLSSLEFLTPAEERLLLVEWNETQSDYPADLCLHELFEAQVDRTPEATALVFEDQRLSYRELNRRANLLAHHLRELGAGPEMLVGVLMERSLEMVIAVLGVLKSGAAYLPLDPTYPTERLGFMLEDAGVKLILTQQRLVKGLVSHQAQMVCLDANGCISGAGRTGDEQNPARKATPDNLAYVIYTSGSTGQPKGVMIPHRSVVSHNFAVAARYDLSAADRVLQFASLSFDVAVEEIFPSWLRGAAVVVRPDSALNSHRAIFELIKKEQISVVNLSTPYWNELMVELAQTQSRLNGSLRLAAIGGEKGLPEGFDFAQQQIGDRVRLLNVYGPTETTVTNTAYEFERNAGHLQTTASVAIGRPIANNQVYLLDSHMCPVPVGVTGEVYIGGESLARGYLRRAALTAEKFVPNPFSQRAGTRLYRTGDLARYLKDGNIEFVGRVDEQVKVRGFRIELTEIEAILIQHSSVREVVVIVRGEAGRDKRIVAYVVLQSGAELSAGELRSYLKQRLPDYMVPAYFVFLETLPLTPNGKVDRRALPAPELTRAGGDNTFVAPRTALEELLAGLWAELLGVAEVSIDDDFFELGGHSLLATQLVSRMRESLGLEIALRELFEQPTVRGLSERIERESSGVNEGEVSGAIEPVARVTGEGQVVSFAQQRLWFLDQLEPGSAFYNVPAAIRLKGQLNAEALQRSLSEIVRRHEVLRTHFAEVEDQPVQIIDEARPLPMPLIDFGALDHAQRETEALAFASEEARRPFDLSTGPLLRVHLLRLGAEEHILLLTMHHIVSDGWSVGVLIREAAALYEAYAGGEESPLAELPVQYADYAAWQHKWLRDEILEQQLAYWRTQLAGTLPVLELPTDNPRPDVLTYRGASLSVMFPLQLSRAIKQLSRQQSCTLYMTLLAAFESLMCRETGATEVLVGTASANRNRRETEGLIGFFVNMLVMRGDLRGQPTFVELMKQVREVALGAYAHQDVPFEKLVEEFGGERKMSQTPLFQVAFGVNNTPRQELRLGALEISAMPVGTEAGRYDLTLWVEEEEECLKTTWYYNTDLFGDDRLRQLAGRYEKLIESAVAEPQARVSVLDILSDEEKNQRAVERKQREVSNLEKLRSSKRKTVTQS